MRFWSVLIAGLVAGAGCTQTTELLAPSAECPAPNPIVHLGGTGDLNCAGALAARFGRYALCTCGDLTLYGGLSVANLVAPGVNAAAPPGAVGVNGSAVIFATTNVNGTLIGAGVVNGVKVGTGSLLGNVHSGSIMQTLYNTHVAGDAFAVTGIAGPYVVSGTLHLPNGPGVLLGAEVQASTVVREPVVVSPPCPCGPQPPLGPPAPVTPLFDIGAAVDERSARNANTTIPFADAFAGEIDEIQTFDWPCGEFYLPGIRTGAQAALEFRVHGRTGIFVDGDVYLGNSLTVTLDPGAELDLVVAGSLISNGRLLGAPSSPARVRLWIGSTTLSLSDQILVGAVVYAPLATLVIGFMASLNGSVLVSNVNDNGNGLHLFYDPAAASAGMSCGISPMPEVE